MESATVADRTAQLQALMAKVAQEFVDQSGHESAQVMSLDLLEMMPLEGVLLETLALLREEALLKWAGLVGVAGQAD